LSRQASQWELDTAKWKGGTLRKHWNDIGCQDLKGIGIIWGEAQHLAVDRVDWHWCVAHCVFSMGWTNA